MKKKYILAIDQGTTSTRAIIFNDQGKPVASAAKEIRQIYPHPGWVEHDANEYWESTMCCIAKAFSAGNITASEIDSIGITCQRETVILWDKETGEPLYNAIVWQSRQSASICEELKDKGFADIIRKKTGLFIDAYFSGTKIKWMMENVPGINDKIKRRKVLAGNVDSYLIWKLSGRAYHVEDCTNASRTMLMNIHTLKWDEELLDMLSIPSYILPDIKQSCGIIAKTDPAVFFGESIPISGDAGDQQAALFGQACFYPGMAKNTYGTALALMMNTGDVSVMSSNGLMTDLAWCIKNKPVYALEGLVFIGGAAIQWLRDGLGLISTAAQSQELALKVSDTGGVYMVPAFTGLCAPYWDMYARGLLIGITRGTTKEHIVRSALESMAYQTKDVLDSMIADCGQSPKSLRVDGGAVENTFLMQFQSDILGIPVEVPEVTEMTALGAAYLAGLGTGYWSGLDQISAQWRIAKVYEPKMSIDERTELYTGWKKAVARSLDWAKH